MSSLPSIHAPLAAPPHHWSPEIRLPDFYPRRPFHTGRLLVLARILLLPLTALEVPNAADKSAALGPMLARVSRHEAVVRARRALPDAQIKSATLKIKNHLPRWCLGLLQPHAHALTHVQIDALDGKLVKMDMKARKPAVRRMDDSTAESP